MTNLFFVSPQNISVKAYNVCMLFLFDLHKQLHLTRTKIWKLLCGSAYENKCPLSMCTYLVQPKNNVLFKSITIIYPYAL